MLREWGMVLCSGNVCAVEMFVQGKGVEFVIASGFRETSMLNAARVCYERLEKALNDLGLSI